MFKYLIGIHAVKINHCTKLMSLALGFRHLALGVEARNLYFCRLIEILCIHIKTYLPSLKMYF